MPSLRSLVLPALASAALTCRPEGPVLPKPRLTSLDASKLLSEAAANLTATLDDALSGAIVAGWDTRNVSFSLALVSADQHALSEEGGKGGGKGGVPLWEYHHLASANERGTREVGKDSRYLVGSVSKLVSDHVLLRSGVDARRPVTDWLPGLAGSAFGWEGVSLEMLASHLAGAPTNYGFSEYYYLKEVFQAYGLPPIPDSAYPPCGVISLNEGCSEQDFLTGMRDAHPVAAPNERPAYSNAAFAVIFMALEQATGRGYAELLREVLAGPLGMNNTVPSSSSPGDDGTAVIPPGESSWGSDYSYNAPAGGLVSTLSDLSKFLHAILSRTLPGTSPSETRAWLQPRSFAGSSSSPLSAVGAPWEITRVDDGRLTPAHPHPVTVHAKSGGAVGYRSQVSLVDEYGVGVAALTAGPMSAAPVLHDAVLAAFVPVVDEISRVEAGEQYGRTFRGGNGGNGGGKGKNGNVTMEATFALDEDSMIIQSMHRGGKDMVAAMVDIWAMTMGDFLAPVVRPIRLFPTALVDHDVDIPASDGKMPTAVTRETWRLWPTLDWPTGSDLPGLGLEKDGCFTWTVGDWVHYGGEPIDRVLFYRDAETGDVVGFEVPFLRSGILRPE
ncbi:hypothetical protein N3K66_008912 [Trichothecium roseum]|uniref:Uncharacterized protein n=1 Tax=Trichothecium roseum TaxID=47278 RepID=A0ACC0URP9_9HYPO|nr:hypothetical protein N3K66_008912 [Trichothecium roseum]